MHDWDKIGRSVIGELVWMDRNSGVINTFQPGKLIDVSFICYNVLYHIITNNLYSTGKEFIGKFHLHSKHFYSTQKFL